MMKALLSAAAFGTAFFLSGCTTTYSAATVSTSAVGNPSNVRQGTVIAVRPVIIRPENSQLGIAGGAVLGWLAGSEFGGGRKAQTAGGIIGAVAGGAAGNEAGKALNTKEGLAITVDFGGGDVREIVQPADTPVRVGQTVNVAYRVDGAFISPVY